ncbi:hypothetical protein CP97_06200 [Aurantiacibacter atlanticus]|uniref:histidine kinase n=1 Tax=Aurantiacibacter atlanticus TaxID=1648404 RepID=A0A0H4VF64_9SPHN|nr:HAMP domain-containing sensor histidine kinase [Aurantiacibacter atlanticus]AKQ41699.1 hypothetical protein CP97_06200 [Aurantiacibacter atlanticus]
MTALQTSPGWNLSSVLDFFIPKAMIADVEQHRRARMFMLSHTFGPILGNTLPAYLYLINGIADYRVVVFFLSITAFWIYPVLLRLTGRYRLLAFISVQNLAFCVIWACYAFGGLLSPFLPWMLIIPLLSFLYLPSEGWTRDILLLQLFANLSALLFVTTGGVALPPLNLEELEVIGMISMGSVAIYFGMMALYFAKMFHEQREFGQELDNLVSSSDNLRNLTAAARQAGAAKADFIAGMSHELRTPLNAIIGYSQLLLEEAEDEGDSANKGDLHHIHSSGSQLLYLIDHVLDYSRIEAGRMPINARPDKVATAFVRWRGEVAKKAPGVALSLDEAGHNERVFVTDWTAMAAIVGNMVSGIAYACKDGQIRLRFCVIENDGISLRLESFDAAGRPHPISLTSEIFDDSQDISPTKYGAMGIEPALALKYIQLLGGDILKERCAGDEHELIIIFPPVTSVQPTEGAHTQLA